jgi:hypothetical protein
LIYFADKGYSDGKKLRIKEHFNPGFSSVVLAGISGFLHEFMVMQDEGM